MCRTANPYPKYERIHLGGLQWLWRPACTCGRPGYQWCPLHGYPTYYYYYDYSRGLIDALPKLDREKEVLD